MIEAGAAVMNGFWEGLLDVWDGIADFFTGIGDWIVANKGPEAYDRRLLIPAGKWIMGGFDKGLQSGFRGVDSTISGIAGQIEARFSSLGPDVAGGGFGAGFGGGVTVNQTINAAPGMSEHAVGDISVAAIEYELAGVS